MSTNSCSLGHISGTTWAYFTASLVVPGPGFSNITLKGEWLAERLGKALADERLGVAPADPPQTVVVGYSHPNLAKEMHVGHLRSTIIGDALVRILEFLGHRVIRHNHMGDWGTQFGMLLAYMDRLKEEQGGADLSRELADLEGFYQASRQQFDSGAAISNPAIINHCLA